MRMLRGVKGPLAGVFGAVNECIIKINEVKDVESAFGVFRFVLSPIYLIEAPISEFRRGDRLVVDTLN